MRLPEAFTDRMKALLKEEYQQFEDSYEANRSYGLRRNEGKAAKDAFEKNMPFSLTPVPWAREGYYYKEEDRPGKHLLHEAGAYYIQEPSAMAVVEALDPVPGDIVLDLCAAPGGKTTQIGARLQGEGVLVANEIVPQRAKILSQNVERMGIGNCVVCNESPDRLQGFFPAFFDKIVVDAPCSGEGMFRKDEVAVAEWSVDNVKHCAKRQDEILACAANMLKPGGVLVYSTCTFAPLENEGTITRFLQTHEDWVLEELPNGEYFEPGQQTWYENAPTEITKTRRLWPHKINGEGHFVAKLKKPGVFHSIPMPGSLTGDKKLVKEVCQFLEKELELSDTSFSGNLISFGEQVYLLPAGISSLKGLKVERPGLQLCQLKKNRIEPAHALAMSRRSDMISKKIALSLEDGERYMKGESIYLSDHALPSGWVFVTCCDYVIGYGKVVNGQLKNHYPKGLRKN